MGAYVANCYVRVPRTRGGYVANCNVMVYRNRSGNVANCSVLCFRNMSGNAANCAVLVRTSGGGCEGMTTCDINCCKTGDVAR